MFVYNNFRFTNKRSYKGVIIMIVKNKKKFVRAILLIIGISIGINLLISTTAFSHQDLKYKTVSVSSGDTLWNIAEKEQRSNYYYKGKDVRDVISDIKAANGLNSSNLTVAQTLSIPTY